MLTIRFLMKPRHFETGASTQTPLLVHSLHNSQEIAGCADYRQVAIALGAPCGHGGELQGDSFTSMKVRDSGTPCRKSQPDLSRGLNALSSFTGRSRDPGCARRTIPPTVPGPGTPPRGGGNWRGPRRRPALREPQRGWPCTRGRCRSDPGRRRSRSRPAPPAWRGGRPAGSPRPQVRSLSADGWRSIHPNGGRSPSRHSRPWQTGRRQGEILAWRGSVAKDLRRRNGEGPQAMGSCAVD